MFSSCLDSNKVVLAVPTRKDLSKLFYQIAWQSIATNTEIHPFEPRAIRREAAQLKEFGRRLLDTSASREPDTTNTVWLKHIGITCWTASP